MRVVRASLLRGYKRPKCHLCGRRPPEPPHLEQRGRRGVGGRGRAGPRGPSIFTPRVERSFHAPRPLRPRPGALTASGWMNPEPIPLGEGRCPRPLGTCASALPVSTNRVGHSAIAQNPSEKNVTFAKRAVTAARDARLSRPEGPRAPGGRHAAAGAPATAERRGLTTALLFLLPFLCLIFWIFVPWFSGYASVRSRLFREGRRA